MKIWRSIRCPKRTRSIWSWPQSDRKTVTGALTRICWHKNVSWTGNLYIWSQSRKKENSKRQRDQIPMQTIWHPTQISQAGKVWQPCSHGDIDLPSTDRLLLLTDQRTPTLTGPPSIKQIGPRILMFAYISLPFNHYFFCSKKLSIFYKFLKDYYTIAWGFGVLGFWGFGFRV